VILAAGLTPAWQQILLFDRFATGEVNRAREAHWCASGKVINVGRGLFHLGAESRTLSLVGGATGESIRREFAGAGISARWVETSSATRVCTTILDAGRGMTTELVENTAAATSNELSAFARAFAEEASRAGVVVLSGSLPAGAPSEYYRDLMRGCSARVILDVRGAELLAALDARPWLVKPNREELARTLQADLTSDAALIDAMRELNRRGAEWVVVTRGPSATWATSGGQVYRARPPACEVVNPIGCGDALCAGIAWSIDRGEGPLEALRMGMGAAADNLGQLLPCRLDPRRVRELAGRVEVRPFSGPAGSRGES